MKSMFVYILECSDKSYYTGVTNNPDVRLAQHNKGENITSYTFSRRPVKLVFQEVFQSPLQAIAFEKKVKKWSRAKKEGLINDQYEKLPELSKKKFKK
jgi:putative endonuclease